MCITGVPPGKRSRDTLANGAGSHRTARQIAEIRGSLTPLRAFPREPRKGFAGLAKLALRLLANAPFFVACAPFFVACALGIFTRAPLPFQGFLELGNTYELCVRGRFKSIDELLLKGQRCTLREEPHLASVEGKLQVENLAR